MLIYLASKTNTEYNDQDLIRLAVELTPLIQLQQPIYMVSLFI
jgi:hypothetical protein